MTKFLKIFLIAMVAYHIIVTVLIYGRLGGAYPQLATALRDGVWILALIMIFSHYANLLAGYRKNRRYPIISFGVLILFAISFSIYQDKNLFDILIGLKYGFMYLFIFLATTALGYFISKRNDVLPIIKRLGNRTMISILIVIVIGFVWQALKLWKPDRFMHIGYGPLNDFVFGDKPPLYYLTGLDGTLRRQGIFAGPNNYGYFLVAFRGMFLFRLQDRQWDIRKFFQSTKQFGLGLAFVLWLAAIILTLSRTAYIGTGLILIIFYWSEIKKYRKISLPIFVVAIAALVGLSVVKGTSTLAHFTSTINAIKYIIANPIGIGLGTAGPAIHHNGTILPENYYLQIIIDIGVIGFVIWLILAAQIRMMMSAITRHINSFKHSPNMRSVVRFWKGLSVGMIALLVMGLFLHVFEDSMVIYRFFIVRGFFCGFLGSLFAVKYKFWNLWK